MKCGNAAFNHYIKPCESIAPRATEVHGLTNENGELYLHGRRVDSVPLRVVLEKLLQFLKSLNKACILVAHNCNTFDGPRLNRNIEAEGLKKEFDKVITGFVDSLVLFRKKFPERKSAGQCKLVTLATETLGLSVEGAHDASNDVDLLEKLVDHHFETEQLLKSLREKRRSDHVMRTLQPLQGVISETMLKKLAGANLTYDLLKSTYESGEEELIELLENRVDGKPQLIKTKKILYEIVNHFKTPF